MCFPRPCRVRMSSSTSAVWACSSPDWPTLALLRPASTEDRVHQPARTALFPEAPEILGALVASGALAASWSGAGPSLIGIVRTEAAPSVLAGAHEALAATGVPGRALVLQPDRRGIVYGDEAAVDL